MRKDISCVLIVYNYIQIIVKVKRRNTISLKLHKIVRFHIVNIPNIKFSGHKSRKILKIASELLRDKSEKTRENERLRSLN